jgi:hypothetical protein
LNALSRPCAAWQRASIAFVNSAAVIFLFRSHAPASTIVWGNSGTARSFPSGHPVHHV